MTEIEPTSRPPSGERPALGLGRGGRMSRRRKLGAVLRLLRGERPGARLARVGCDRRPADGRTSWPPVTRERDDRDLQIARLRAKVGELVITNQLLGAKVEHLEAGRPLARPRSRR